MATSYCIIMEECGRETTDLEEAKKFAATHKVFDIVAMRYLNADGTLGDPVEYTNDPDNPVQE